MGDLNSDLLSENNTYADARLNFSDVYGLKQLITEPTPITPSTCSRIDLIFTNRPDCVCLLGVSHVREIFNWVSKVIRNCIGFALLRSVIGLENSRHPLNQSDAKLKPIATWSLAFSRAWDRLRVFTLSSHWFVVIFIFVLIGCCDYFGFGFSTVNCISEHSLVFAFRKISIPAVSKGNKLVNYIQFKHFESAKFRTDILSQPSDILKGFLDPNEMWLKWVCVMLTLRSNPNDCSLPNPWITTKLKKRINYRDQGMPRFNLRVAIIDI